MSRLLNRDPEAEGETLLPEAKLVSDDIAEEEREDTVLLTKLLPVPTDPDERDAVEDEVVPAKPLCWNNVEFNELRTLELGVIIADTDAFCDVILDSMVALREVPKIDVDALLWRLLAETELVGVTELEDDVTPVKVL